MTDVLTAIDAAVADWDASPHSWVPGDPLHPHPHLREPGDGNCVRPMVEVHGDPSWIRARCVPCDVTWAGPAPCWVCGQDRPTAAVMPPVTMRVTVEVGQAMRAARDLEQSMARLTAQFRESADRSVTALAALERWASAHRSIPEPAPPRPVMSRCLLLPVVANPGAPTRAELEAATDIGDLVLGFDLARPDVPPLVGVVRRPPVPHAPARLSIDGRAYRRRTRARRGNR